MSVAEERARAVAETVEKIRQVERDKGVTRESLEEIKGHLVALASREELFPMEDFPMPGPGDKRNSCLYRLSEDDDHRFALYANAAKTGVDTPAHNHTTWAVIAGVRGEERNQFYRHTEGGGVEQTGEHTVGAGSGVAFMPDDLHSIHIHGDVPVLNFHMYGLALEQLHKREYYKPEENAWQVFPAHSDIREARAKKVGA
ncbi:MAG: hypothetical protein MI806_00350 [Minwuiales bacterium]|nr:hypothetical protein [Minwuiales bacterium]